MVLDVQEVAFQVYDEMKEIQEDEGLETQVG